MLVRPRSTPIEARQWTGDNEAEMREWLGYAFVGVNDERRTLLIEGRDGRVVVRCNEHVVHLDTGFYPMEPALFSAKYEAAK